MKAIKGLFKLFFILLLLCAIAIGALLFLVDLNDYKKEIEQLAAKQNVILTLEGDLGWSFYPRLGIRSGRLTVLPPVQGIETPIAFDSLNLSIKIKPLLDKRIEAQTIHIQGGTLTMQQDANNALLIKNLELRADGLNLENNAFPLSLSMQLQTSTQNKITQTIDLNSQLTASLEKTLKQITVAKSSHTIKYQGDALPGKTVNIKAAFPANIDLAKSVARLETLSLKLDDTQFNGDLEADFAEIPYLKLNLNGDSLDASRYMDESTTDESEAEKKLARKNREDAPLIPAESLRGVPGEYVVTLKKLSANGLQFKDTAIDVHITPQGLMTINELSTKAYEGEFDLQGIVDMRTDTPNIQMDLSLTPIQVEPLLKAVQKTDNVAISGDFAFIGSIKTFGQTQNQLIQALNGTLDFNAESLILNEVDITQSLDATLLQLMQAEIPQLAASEDKTVMSDVVGKNLIKNGVVINTSLNAKALCSRFEGRGNYGLLDSAVDYRMNIIFPSDDTNSACTEINPRLKDIEWPVECKGYAADEPADLCKVDQSAVEKILAKSVQKEAGKKINQELNKELEKKFGKDAEAVKDVLKSFF